MSQNFNRLKLIDKIAETADSASFIFEVPADLSSDYEYIPGQYLTVEFEVGGETLRRAYSIFTAPYENKFGCTVKRLKGGRVSNHMIDNVHVGDEVNVMVPEGKFVLEANESLSRDHYFIAGGSGITPVMSMVKTVLEHEPKSRAYLLYCNRNESSIIFKNEIDEMEEKFAGQFFIVNNLSQPHKEKKSGLKGLFGKSKMNWQGWHGRLDGGKLQKFFDHFKAVSGDAHYYLCGPGGLIQTAENFIKNMSVDSSRIHKEYFTTADVNEPKSSGTSSTGCHATVTLNGETFELDVPADKTLLEALMDLGKDAPYSCTSGACSTCVAKITKGSVEMDACFALDDDEIKDGYVLTCQARATTSELEVVFEG